MFVLFTCCVHIVHNCIVLCYSRYEQISIQQDSVYLVTKDILILSLTLKMEREHVMLCSQCINVVHHVQYIL